MTSNNNFLVNLDLDQEIQDLVANSEPMSAIVRGTHDEESKNGNSMMIVDNTVKSPIRPFNTGETMMNFPRQM